MIHAYGDRVPEIHPEAFVHPMATVIGGVKIGREASIWPGASLRGDEEPIVVGAHTSIQDNCTMHNYENYKPTVIGAKCTIGHNVVLHGCQVGDLCLVGMGSVLLDGCEIGTYSFVAAGSLVTPRKIFPPRSFIMGSPARVVREIKASEIEAIEAGWRRYSEQARTYRSMALPTIGG